MSRRLVISRSQAAFQSLYSRQSALIGTMIPATTRLLVRAAITGIVFAVVAMAIVFHSAGGRAAIIVASAMWRKHGTSK